MSLSFKNYTILVADDSRLVTSTITSLLKKLGCEQIHCAYALCARLLMLSRMTIY